MDYTIILTVGGIVLADLLLSGDNAILIALASRNLPKEQQKQAILWGTIGAIALRLLFAVVASMLVTIPLIKAFGGLVLLWIAVKLIADDDNHSEHAAAGSLKAAIKTIIIADGIMSLDNVLAVVALADGHIGLVVFGIAVSIPFVMLSSQWLLKMIARYPIIVYLGALVLGYAAAEMITSDLWLAEYLHSFAHVIDIILAVVVVISGWWLKRKNNKAV